MRLTQTHKLGLSWVLSLATLAVAWLWGEWLRDLLIRPMVISWLWFVYYVTHLPQAALWFAIVGLLALMGMKTLRPLVRERGTNIKASKVQPEGSRGPVSAWQQVVDLSISGSLYRHKLRRFLQQQVDTLERVSPETQQFLADTQRRRFDLHARANEEGENFNRLLQQTLEELVPQGGQHTTR